MLNKSGDIFVKIIEEDVSLKQKFGIQDKRKIKELENKLEKLSNEKTELEKRYLILTINRLLIFQSS